MCNIKHCVDLNSAESLGKLPGMHLDHDCDLKRVCDRWSLVESIPTHVKFRGRSQTHQESRVPDGALAISNAFRPFNFTTRGGRPFEFKLTYRYSHLNLN